MNKNITLYKYIFVFAKGCKHTLVCVSQRRYLSPSLLMACCSNVSPHGVIGALRRDSHACLTPPPGWCCLRIVRFMGIYSSGSILICTLLWWGLPDAPRGSVHLCYWLLLTSQWTQIFTSCGLLLKKASYVFVGIIFQSYSRGHERFISADAKNDHLDSLV